MINSKAINFHTVVLLWFLGKYLNLSANNEIITIMKIFALGFTTMRAVAPVRPNKKNRRAFFLFNFSHFNFFIVFWGGMCGQFFCHVSNIFCTDVAKATILI